MKLYRSLFAKYRSSRLMQLRMVPMIDVVFLLLVFFLLSANFRSQEGFLPAELPQYLEQAQRLEMEPLLIYLASQPDGSCRVQIGSERVFDVSSPTTFNQDDPAGGSVDTLIDFQQLGREIQTVIASQGRTISDPVKLVPTSRTKWDHVVKTYNALWQINLRNVIFAMVD
ncbi:MAG: biopolymer transporter ExbD [Sedimentisphaerales bacterium]|nr:biopolymer transporter ExbD [Sedimentisphaerales bacterium]